MRPLVGAIAIDVPLGLSGALQLTAAKAASGVRRFSVEYIVIPVNALVQSAAKYTFVAEQLCIRDHFVPPCGSGVDRMTQAPTPPNPPTMFSPDGTGKNSLPEPVITHSYAWRSIA